ncbi:MAG TPA: MFS transporter [Syntrophomonadaceae bacterium]|nr:MFS transporter [Syntrophomonadaceae bacterium]
MSKASSVGQAAFNNPFIPLKHRNFRYYWIGMCVSLIGTWMQSVAQPWLAYSLTNSALLLGLVGAMQYTPALFLSLFAGVVVDRWPIKRIIYFTQASSGLVVLALALLVYSGEIYYWHILVMAGLMGLVNTLDMPARQAFVVQLVGKDDLMNAIALNSVAFNTARVIGPALAGILMAYYGVGICFLINSFSFAAVLISLLFVVPLPFHIERVARESVWTELKHGLRYVVEQRTVLETIVLVAILGIFALNNNVLLPVFNQEVLLRGERSLGFLFSLAGVGSLFGALTIASLSRTGPRNGVLYTVPIAIGILLILVTFSSNFWLAGLYLAAMGFFFNLFSSTANTTVQVYTPDQLRGRVMSLYTLVFVGTTPLGNLYAGWSCEFWGPQYGFAACGIMVLVALVVLYLLREYAVKRSSETDTIDSSLRGSGSGSGE